MKYRNTHPTSALEFKLGKLDYAVPHGGVVEIPDQWAPWVVSRGLYLEPAPVAPLEDPVAMPEESSAVNRAEAEGPSPPTEPAKPSQKPTAKKK